MRKNLLIVIGVVIILALAVVYSFKSKTNAPEPSPTPTVSGWQTFNDSARGIQFQYPETLGTKYIQTTTEWPPSVSLKSGSYACSPSGAEVMLGGQTQEKIIGGQTYCITKESEGAAGSTYTTYSYSFTLNGKVATLTFVLRYPQCANYEEPSKSECGAEENSFDVNTLADKIASTVTVTSAPVTSQSGITGTVLLGPTCPVVRNPPDPQCADKPYAVALIATAQNGNSVQFNSSSSGTFRVTLPPGTYSVSSAGTNFYPRCSSNGTITVLPNAFTTTTISCDTGIR